MYFILGICAGHKYYLKEINEVEFSWQGLINNATLYKDYGIASSAVDRYTAWSLLEMVIKEV